MGPFSHTLIKQIAIVGGGPLGLSTAKYLMAEKCFEVVDIFEQSYSVEGTWAYSSPDAKDYTPVPQTNPHQVLEQPRWNKSSSDGSLPCFLTAMYDKLETNIPKPLMTFSDQDFPQGTPLFPPRQVVSRYMNEYAKEVLHLIKFGSQVINVKLLDLERESWQIESKDLKTGKESIAIYDAVAVCTGHYTVPFVPKYPGLEIWNEEYSGAILHTKLYRSPDPFANKKVLVIGNSASGVDIANQVKTVCKQPLLLSQRNESFLATPGDHSDHQIKSLPGIAEFIEPSQGDRAIRFVNGVVETEIDVVLFATGYLYSFPFLPNNHLDLIRDGSRVEHVYQHLFHMKHPSIAFIGLPIRITPFPISEVQAALVARVWSGRLQLPSKALMAAWEVETLERNGSGRKFHTIGYPKDVDYQRELYDWVAQAGLERGKLPVRWNDKHAWIRERFPAIKSAYAKKGEDRRKIQHMEQLGFCYEAWKEEEIGGDKSM